MSIFSFAYFAVAALLIVVSFVIFCLNHPETAKLIGTCALVVFLFLVSIAYVPALAEEPDVYPLTAVITNINYEEDFAVVEDGSGYIWEFYGTEDYEIGDLVSMLMWNAETPDDIKDDEILDVVYAGFNLYCL